ncbi:hypothetical protein CEXT_547931 [Caerostris extrusa]|uniref:Transposase n=1 Tax=Caerostris extrusa TaxID=172846 RepID=A0AAV4NXQ7_CAEEX|nr:hypothetical protein CEXT_547931 [Caerostris extrusa]
MDKAYHIKYLCASLDLFVGVETPVPRGRDANLSTETNGRGKWRREGRIKADPSSAMTFKHKDYQTTTTWALDLPPRDLIGQEIKAGPYEGATPR